MYEFGRRKPAFVFCSSSGRRLRVNRLELYRMEKGHSWLTRREASAYLRDQHGIMRSPATLAKLASVGGGPIFQKRGKAASYTKENLDRFADEITSKPVRTTSELRAA